MFFFNRINEPVQLVRHTKVAHEDYALAILQEKDWPYFIERILLISEKRSVEIESLGAAVDANENELVLNKLENLDITKAVNNNLYRVVADNLTESLAYCPMVKLEDMKLNG